MVPATHNRLTPILLAWMIAGVPLTRSGWLEMPLASVGGDGLWLVAMPAICLAWVHFGALVRGCAATIMHLCRRRPRAVQHRV